MHHAIFITIGLAAFLIGAADGYAAETVPAVATLKVHKAMFTTRVYLNGQLVGDHAPSFTPGLFDVRPHLKGEGRPNELIIRVGASRKAGPPGRPDGWDFEEIRYIPGIYDSVELLLSGSPHVVRVQTVPDVEGKAVRVVAWVKNVGPATRAPVRFTVREVKSGREVGAAEAPPADLAPGADVLRTRFGVRSFRFDWSSLRSPILLEGGDRTAFRDTAVIYHDGLFRMFYSYCLKEKPGDAAFWQLAVSRSPDLIHWTEPRTLTPRDLSKNFAAPGNVVRFGDEWILSLQTYPTPNGEKFGNADSRIWIMRSPDLENWSQPELLRVKGPDVPVADMGRMIDPFLLEDKDEPGKWWCFYKQNGASMSWSRDLKTWTFFGRVSAGENVCVLVEGGEYVMFHSPHNGIGVKRSKNLKDWRDAGPLITLGQKDWPWARGRLTAGFVLDLKDDPRFGKYVMFFHGSGPEDERTMFSDHASIGIAWSDDLVTWSWPGQ